MNRGKLSFQKFSLDRYEKTDFGICDECGSYTETLALVAGEWVCASCTRFG